LPGNKKRWEQSGESLDDAKSLEADRRLLKKSSKPPEVFSDSSSLFSSKSKKEKPGRSRAFFCSTLILFLVPKAGLEPARLAPLPPQDSVSTRFHHLGKSV